MTTSWKWTPNRADMAKFHKIAEAAIKDGAEFLLEDANRRAPIETGTLVRSGMVSTEGTRAAVSYDTPYAARQHEMLHYQHAKGREAKWLQRTFEAKVAKVGAVIAAKIKAAAG